MTRSPRPRRNAAARSRESSGGFAFEVACPYLGLRADLASVFMQPTTEHRCTAGQSAQEIVLEHQAAFCLSWAFRACPHYPRASRARPTSLDSAEPSS